MLLNLCYLLVTYVSHFCWCVIVSVFDIIAIIEILILLKYYIAIFKSWFQHIFHVWLCLEWIWDHCEIRNQHHSCSWRFCEERLSGRRELCSWSKWTFMNWKLQCSEKMGSLRTQLSLQNLPFQSIRRTTWTHDIQKNLHTKKPFYTM